MLKESKKEMILSLSVLAALAIIALVLVIVL